VAVLDDELNGVVFRVHVGHFALQAVVPHYRGSEDDCEVLGCHLWIVSIASGLRGKLRQNIPSSRFPGLPHVQDERLRTRDNRGAWVATY
jgi:hypothetical protein